MANRRERERKALQRKAHAERRDNRRPADAVPLDLVRRAKQEIRRADRKKEA